MTAVVPNTLRRGSAGWAAVEAVKEHGPLAPSALALTIDKPADEIEGLLRFPVRMGFLRIGRDGRYALGNGVPLPDTPGAAQPAPQPADSRLPAGAGDERPSGQAQRVPLDRPAAPTQPAPAPVPAEAAPTIPLPDGMDIDAVHRRRNEQQVQQLRTALAERKPPRAAPPERTAVSEEPVAGESVAGMARRAVDRVGAWAAHAVATAGCTAPPTSAAPAVTTAAEMARRAIECIDAVAERNRMVAAWRSDGIYVIEKGSLRIELNRDEALELFEHMAVVARAA